MGSRSRANWGRPRTYKDAVQNSFRDMLTSAGLKLENRKVSQETIVVDHLEKVPTEN